MHAKFIITFIVYSRISIKIYLYLRNKPSQNLRFIRGLYLLAKHPQIIQDIISRKKRHEIREHVLRLDKLSLHKKNVAECNRYINFMKKAGLTSVPNKFLVPKERLNSICNIEDWDRKEMKDILDQITAEGNINLEGWEYSISNVKTPLIHRKDWEWAMGILAMRKLGKLNEHTTALGIGAGKEVVLYYLANHVKEVFSSDLYGTPNWKFFAPIDFPKNPKRYAPFPFRYQRLMVLRMDGRKIAFAESSFDVVFSFSSIEHFGGGDHAGALESLKEMERVLKPGGVAVITTEYILNGKEHKDFFNEHTIYSDLIHGVERLKLVGPLDTAISADTLDTVMDVEDAVKWDTNKLTYEYKMKHPYIVLRYNNILLTSVILVFQKESTK